MTALVMNPPMGNDPLGITGGTVGQKPHHQGMGMEPAPPYTMEQMMYSNPGPQYGAYMYQQNQGLVYDGQGMYTELQSPTTMSEQSMSPSPPPPPRMYKPCVVCIDKSSGYHYGVSSCEGCKGFFRRSVQKNMQYTCHKDKCCVINKVTRNRCQYCRLQKCFAMGMSKEAVRNDRNKKKKDKKESQSPSPEDSQTVTDEEMKLLEDIYDAHKSTYSRDDVVPLSPLNINSVKLAGLSDNCRSRKDKVKSEPNFSEVDNSSKDDKRELTPESIMLWEKITELSSRGIIKIVDFAKKIPGFLSLSTSDQITLLKAACLEIMILRLSSRYDLESDTMVFSGGVKVTRSQLESAGFGSLTDTIFRFARSLREMDVDEMELATLCCICLISGDRSGLESPGGIESMQEPILEALKHYVKSRRKDQPQVYAKMLMKITDLRSISVKENIIRLSNRLDPDEALSYSVPHLDPNCLQRETPEAHAGYTSKFIIKKKDIDRTVGINTGHMGTSNFKVEPEDREFVKEPGRRSSVTFLRYYTVQNKGLKVQKLPNSLMGKNRTNRLNLTSFYF